MVFGERVFVDVTELRILRENPPGLPRWTLNSMVSIFIRDIKGEDKWNRGESHVKTKPEIGMRQTQAKKSME